MSAFSISDTVLRKNSHTPLKDLNENGGARRVLNASGKKQQQLLATATMQSMAAITATDSPGDGESGGGGLAALLAGPSGPQSGSTAPSFAPTALFGAPKRVHVAGSASTGASTSAGAGAGSIGARDRPRDRDIHTRDPSTTVSASTVAGVTANVDAILAGANANKKAIADNLLQAKIDHLERERVELSLQLHLRDEKDRSRKIKIERLEKSMDELTKGKTESDSKCAAMLAERDGLVQKLAQLDHLQQQQSLLVQGQTQSSAGAAGAGMSVAAALADSLANPPAYLKEGSTQGLYDKMRAASKELKRMEDECAAMSSEREEAIKKLEQNNKEIAEVREKAEKDRKTMIVLKEAAAEADSLSKEIDELNRDNNNFSQLLDAANKEKEQLQSDISQGKKMLQNLRDTQKRQESELEASSEREKVALAEIQRLVSEVDAVQVQLNAQKKDADEVDSGAAIAAFIAGGGDAQLVALAEDLRARLRDSEAARRKIHGELQDLKGNVRVLVRVRPFLHNDGDCRDTSLTCNKDETSLSVAQQAPNKPANLFHFDRCFGEKSTQDGVYKEVSELIQSSLDGYRVCIFSYGQTGSGKTWTMSGERSGSQRGIIPRAVQQIIEQAIAMKKQGWTVTVNLSVVELYNEELRDLLVGKGQNAAANSDKMKITNSQGRVQVQGLTSTDIETSNLVIGMSQFEQILEQASRARATIATGMNDVSSRSHMIFMMEMTGVHADGVTVTRGGLRLVDLAGSERLDRTGTLNDAARLKETVNINKSLSSLADVFINLGQKSQHIPYRNSKLTMLLQDCLSGTGKSLMIVNVSPTQASTNETLCSLRFADQVSQVELGKAQKQMYMQAASSSSASSSSNTGAGAGAGNAGGLGKAVSRATSASASGGGSAAASAANSSAGAAGANAAVRTKRNSTVAALSGREESDKDNGAATASADVADTSLDSDAAQKEGQQPAAKRSRIAMAGPGLLGAASGRGGSLKGK